MTDITIRVADTHDSDACVEVYREAWRGMTFVPQDLHTPAEDRAWMRDVFARQLVLVAEASDADAASDVGELSGPSKHALSGCFRWGAGRSITSTFGRDIRAWASVTG